MKPPSEEVAMCSTALAECITCGNYHNFTKEHQWVCVQPIVELGIVPQHCNHVYAPAKASVKTYSKNTLSTDKNRLASK